jgi:soluble lytic murein transglycosylase-like protein
MIFDVNLIYQAKVNEIKSRLNVNIGSITAGFREYFESALSSVEQQVPLSSAQNKYPLAAKESTNTNNTIKNISYDDIIKEKSRQYGVSEDLIKAVIQAESGFNPNAVSSAGALGLMQLMPATAAGLGVTDPFDPEQNIDGGVRYLKGQIDRFGGDVKLALAAYNCGPNRVINLKLDNLDNPQQLSRLPKETQNYVKKICGYLE